LRTKDKAEDEPRPYLWCDFTPKSEPISEKIPKLSPDACGRTRPLAPPEKPFAYFLFPPPPPNFFLF
jgi:hypothetical protein